MKARVVVFPIKGRKWCFGRSVDPAAAQAQAASTPSTLRDLWNRIASNSNPLNANAELLVDFASNKVFPLPSFTIIVFPFSDFFNSPYSVSYFPFFSFLDE